jgi:O-succinylbenzoic acid--CoA ligase
MILLVEGEADEKVKTSIAFQCRKLLQKYEQPKKIRFIDLLPRTENGKIDRKRLRCI